MQVLYHIVSVYRVVGLELSIFSAPFVLNVKDRPSPLPLCATRKFPIHAVDVIAPHRRARRRSHFHLQTTGKISSLWCEKRNKGTGIAKYCAILHWLAYIRFIYYLALSYYILRVQNNWLYFRFDIQVFNYRSVSVFVA